MLANRSIQDQTCLNRTLCMIKIDIKQPITQNSSFNHLIEINLMNILDLIYQWGIRQNHAGRRNNNRFDDPNLLLISVGHEAESCRT